MWGIVRVMMEEINNVDDLKKLVYPALTTKVRELKRFGYDFVSEEDIWIIFAEIKWGRQKELALCDIVDDILNVNKDKLYRMIWDNKVNKSNKE